MREYKFRGRDGDETWFTGSLVSYDGLRRVAGGGA